MTAATLERPTTQANALTQPSALAQLVSHIQETGIDSEGTPIVMGEVHQILENLVQHLILNCPNLNQVIQENLDDLRFKTA